MKPRRPAAARKLGRPRKAEPARSILAVRLTDEQRAAVEAAATRKGLDASTWARMIMIGAAAK